MQLVKQMRMVEIRRRLEDPAYRATPIQAIAKSCGYRRADRFARDFREAFGITPTRVRAALMDEKS